MLALITSIAASSSVLVLAVWYGQSRSRHDVRLRTLMEPQRMLAEQSDPFSQRVAFPVVNTLVNVLMAILPTALIGRARRWLLIAGDKMVISQFLTIVLIAATAPPAILFLLIWAASGGSAPFFVWLPVPLAAVMGFLFPFLLLKRASRKRQQIIWRSMPNALDLLTTCVEAGLSLDFGIQRVAEKYPGPLSEEFHRVLREMGLGKPRREALTEMTERIQLPDVTTFINSLVQAEQLGTSIGDVLRVQAKQMRMRRRQRAEQIAHQAPVKMVFPMVLFLMPSLFLITIGPVILAVIRSFQEA
ncbi:MAG: type II secretion system F family protein [Dehalococcoidia bacterium]